MNKKEKSMLTKLNKEEDFKDIVKKLTINIKLDTNESKYILSAAIIFLTEFEKDTSNKSYFELAYYIILKYSIIHSDYMPLNDVSLNYGFYPISKYIYDKSLLKKTSIINEIYSIRLEDFAKQGYTETYDQEKYRNKILNNSESLLSYIAPTSYGKSRVIFEHLSYNLNMNKIVIIVPTKSLISQTAKEVRKRKFRKKIITHDGMYNEESEFIAILTQERALRLLQKHEIYFDLLYIDEAHNLFEGDERNILLQRCITMNYKRNRIQKILYLSPLIADSNNLKFLKDQNIVEQRIDFNIKEPEIFQLNHQKKIYQYNRFVNEFYEIGEEENIFQYIVTKGKLKNFIYLKNPKSVEKFSQNLYKKLPEISKTDEVTKLMEFMDIYVHEDFYIKEYLNKGLLYLHGKIPDHIKDYLEHKFRTIPELKYLVANNVILEGVNLPVDALFILNSHGLNEKYLTNLIGRVNRLDQVFDKHKGSLEKLLPQVHFIDSTYNARNIVTTNKIKILRSRYFTDLVKNPTLQGFDFDKLKSSNLDENKKKKEIENILACEKLIHNAYENGGTDEFKKKMILNGIHQFYKMEDTLINVLYLRSLNLKNDITFTSKNIIDKIFMFFIEDIPVEIKDYEFERLGNEKARKFYTGFLKFRRSTLKKQVNIQLKYFKECKENNDPYYFMGDSYGEEQQSSKRYNDGREVYVNLNKKNDKELINLAIVKIKLEDDFVSFKIRKCVEMLYEVGLIKDEEYNETVYGTNDKNKMNLQKLGFNSTILSKLEKDGQVGNFYLDQYFNIQYNEKFREYKKSLDDYFNYEIDKLVQ